MKHFNGTESSVAVENTALHERPKRHIDSLIPFLLKCIFSAQQTIEPDVVEKAGLFGEMQARRVDQEPLCFTCDAVL